AADAQDERAVAPHQSGEGRLFAGLDEASEQLLVGDGADVVVRDQLAQAPPDDAGGCGDHGSSRRGNERLFALLAPPMGETRSTKLGPRFFHLVCGATSSSFVFLPASTVKSFSKMVSRSWPSRPASTLRR